MRSSPDGIDGRAENTFLWLAPFAPPRGWKAVPQGGMCLCSFLFVTKGGKLLLGKYADHPAWESLSGMESKRIKANAWGWTIPASHLKFGEDPREAARRIGEEILALDKSLAYSEPFVTTFFYEPAIAPGEKHFDVLFLFDVSVPASAAIRKPPWYEALEWTAIEALPHEHFARQHEDVVEAWLKRTGEHLAGSLDGRSAVIH